MAPGARLAFHTYSRFDLPPRTDVVDLEGHRSLRALTDTTALVAKLEPIIKPPVEFFTLDIGEGVTLDGWVADAAFTIPVGPVAEPALQLLETTRESLFAGIAEAKAGNRLGDISAAIQERVERDGLAVIRSLVGHGIGQRMHEDPQIPNFGEPGTGPLLEEGMTFAIEPMVNIGSPGITMGSDNWAVYSEDGSLAAHFEFTVAVGSDGPRILTPWHEE